MPTPDLLRFLLGYPAAALEGSRRYAFLGRTV